MNKFAFNATSFVIKQLYHLSKAKVEVAGEENIPEGSIIFTINHFTRVETLILPYHIQKITKKPVWSLAHHSLFKGAVADFLEKGGAVSTKDPNRDKLIINKLLSGNADWIIFPEGGMIKSKKVMSQGDFQVVSPKGTHRPHTGAANFALRCQFYRERLKWLEKNDPEEMERLNSKFDLSSDFKTNLNVETYIVPVNLTYYPIRARENGINQLAGYLMDRVPEKVNEEIMTEGAMLLDGIDIDIRFGKAIKISDYLKDREVESDIKNKDHYEFDDKISCLDILRKKAEEIMYLYMHGIYSMTTVNHDHIFSALLKNMPSNEIDPQDLKERAYLAATLNIDSRSLFLHKALKKNQVSLLTDDRFHKFHEFFEFCREKGLIEMKDGKLVRNMEKFELPKDLNDIRGVNPVAVFANEIEPLLVLSPHIDRLAKESSFNIHRRVISYLSKKPVTLFEEELEKSENKAGDYIPDKKEGYPFLYQGKEKKNGVVLFHGFLSSPKEMQAIGQYFFKKGFTVYGVRFPGHGTSSEQLKSIKYTQWIDSAEEGIALMKRLCDNVFLCGISLGAAAALILASNLSFIKGVAAIAPPVKFFEFGSSIGDNEKWKSFFGKLSFRKSSEKYYKLCDFPKNRYSVSVPEANKEIVKISNAMFSGLYHIKTPCFVLQSDKDAVVYPDSAKKTYERIGCENKLLLNLSHGGHNIVNTEKKELVFEYIRIFFESLNK